MWRVIHYSCNVNLTLPPLLSSVVLDVRVCGVLHGICPDVSLSSRGGVSI